MPEVTQQWVVLVKSLFSVGFATLYAFGGISGKWKRRWVAPSVFMLGVYLTAVWQETWSLWYLTCWPLMVASLHLGYGADEVSEKIVRRTIAGAAAAVSTLPIFIVSGFHWVFAIHFTACIVVSVLFGVYDIERSPRYEEFIIAGAYSLLPIMCA